ncbi:MULTISPECIES: hydantoinase/oxoprolinase family protein [unclassified Chelatococcus]|uniref:hydantoinase/oxoprolinase family protein n=1 Tax=unclassified Chelatococcus TaxID=2638111 RepID=UPI001BCB4E93|nr:MULTISPECIES: hydantoinase/oxoprolinase family protein [unclassified Chelatococcus]MBS7701367.1 hydantoinase/oxoprolinase family protein [Chelatococcus sp. YT9]
MRRLGIDVGGTFTDVVLIDDQSGRHWSVKVPTTPANRVIGAINGFNEILRISGLSSGEIDFIGHGTTMATNMIVEHKGARTALITTKGFRDILEIRRVYRHDRADLYDLQFDAPKPLVRRRWCLELDERISATGAVEKPLDMAEVETLAEEIRRSDIEAVAICLIHSYVNPDHERQVLETLRARLPDQFVTASFDVNPELMEYERTSTTVINAMLGPVCNRYIRSFMQELRRLGFRGEIMFMQSNGGLASAELVESRPVVLLESGPAGGVSATSRLAQKIGVENILLGDMGGTTFDVSLIREGRPEIRNGGLLHTYSVRSPTIDIDSVGAGGGSIAWIDAGGGVRIGPESAGADPGPACYGRGGQRPTVTDCNVILGYIDPDTFLNGSFKLNREAAHRAVEEHLATPLGVSVVEAAHAVRAIANALMAQAMRLMTVERGYDPRDFTYVCYGGAGPVHAVELARELEIKRVVVPALPGLFSAFGMTVADQSSDQQVAIERQLDGLAPEGLEQAFSNLEETVGGRFGGALANVALTFQRKIDCRYAGQPEPITVDVPKGRIDLGQIRKSFEEAHMRHWNFVRRDHPLVCNNIRVKGEAETGWRGSIDASIERHAASGEKRTRAIYLSGQIRDVPVFRREGLASGTRIDGPAVIEEASSCLVFEAGQRAHIDAQSNLIVEL